MKKRGEAKGVASARLAVDEKRKEPGGKGDRHPRSSRGGRCEAGIGRGNRHSGEEMWEGSIYASWREALDERALPGGPVVVV